MSDKISQASIDDLSKYVVMGIHKDTGDFVMAASPSGTLQDLGMFKGRLEVDIMAHLLAASKGIRGVVAE